MSSSTKSRPHAIMARNAGKSFLQILFFFLLAILFIGRISKVQAQTRQSELLKGAPISTSIKPGENHRYTIKLKERQFALFKLIQQGVDIIITTYDADGKKIEEFDSPTGKNGPEIIIIVSGKKGNYMLDVRPVDEKEPQGNYELNIEKIEPKAVSHAKQVDQLFAAWDNREIPGAAVAVVKDGKIIFKKGYGSANLEYNIPISPSTIFHIASVSKQFTTFSVLLLAQQGKLSLDDDIRKYIPEMPDFGKVITLRHLATHTSGLRDQWELLAMAGWRLDDVITKEHIMKLLSRQKELNFNPGEEFLYCNSGFTLLAEVVARVSGRSFTDFTKEYIFKPLKMSSTFFYDDHEKIVKNRAYSYHADTIGFKKSVLSYANVGATSLFTTVEDLSLWAMNFEKAKLGGRAIIDQMNERGILNNGDTISYALGQRIGFYKGLKYIFHTGSDAGYRTYLGRFPDQELSVIVLSNDASFNRQSMGLKVAEIYLNNKFLKENAKEVDDASTITSKPVLVDSDLLKSYCGQFEIESRMTISIISEENKLYAEGIGISKTLLKPMSSSEFALLGMDAKIMFHKEDDGEVDKLIINLNGQESVAHRIQAFDPTLIILSEFTGDFYSKELSTTYSFVSEAGKLIAKHSRLSDIVLTPTKLDFFSSDQWFFSQIEFVRDDKKNILGCKVSGERVRNLWFDKLYTKSE